MLTGVEEEKENKMEGQRDLKERGEKERRKSSEGEGAVQKMTEEKIRRGS